MIVSRKSLLHSCRPFISGIFHLIPASFDFREMLLPPSISFVDKKGAAEFLDHPEILLVSENISREQSDS